MLTAAEAMFICSFTSVSEFKGSTLKKKSGMSCEVAHTLSLMIQRMVDY